MVSTNLELLHIGLNQLSGQIPAELGSLTNLESLHLAANPLGGPLPAELSSLTNLRELILFENELSGLDPGLSWGTLANLRMLLDLSVQSRSVARYPADVGQPASISRIWPSAENELSGPIPIELGSLIEPEDCYASPATS